MDDFRGGKFIVGSDIRADEQRRMANEFMRNQNESQRLNAENNRNAATSNALGIANNSSRSNFLTQIGLFTAVVLTIIILTVIAILAYEKATNNQSLVDLDNLRKLTLSDLTITDKATMKNLTVTEDINVGDDLITTGGASINQEIKVGGDAIFYDEVWAKKGVSIDAGLSVSGKSHFYDDVIAYQGVSLNNGLSVSGKSHFYDDVIAYQGVSLNNGLSVSGKSHFYGDVIAYQGVSLNNGLSVSGTAIINTGQIKRKKLIFTSSLDGVSTGYRLTNNDGGITYAIENKDSNNITISNKFILPETNQEGLTYNFLWKNNNSQTRNNFQIGISANSTDSINGTVLSAQRGSSVITLATDEDGNGKIGNGVSCKLFYYEGKVYPGAKLECSYLDNIWYLSGTLGVSQNITENGFITENAEWLVAGVSNNEDNVNELLFSHDGRHYVDIPTEFGQNFIKNIGFGSSSDGTNLWNVAVNNNFSGTYTIYYSTDTHQWQQAFTSTNGDISDIACGVSDGVSLWVAVGYTGSGGIILNSTNGTNWTTNTNNILSEIESVAYGLSSDGTSLWVAGGQRFGGTSVLIYSSSGVNWEPSRGATMDVGFVKSLAYGLSSNNESIWLAGGTNGSDSNILYSNDGVSWETIIKPLGFTSDTIVNSIAFGLSDNGTSTLFVAGTEQSSGTSMLYFSTNGTCWRNCSGDTFGTYGVVSDIAYGKDKNNNGLWVATGTNYDGPSRDILISTDGVTWEFPETGDSFNNHGGQAVAYNNLLYPNQGNALGL